jgi:hypothetical protein
MKLSPFFVGALCFVALGCSKPKSFLLADEWHAVGDTEKEKLCTQLKDTPAPLISALQGWIKDATPKIEGKSKELATAISEIKDKGEFEKLVKKIEGFNPDDEPCDKMKAKFAPEELTAYAAVGEQIEKAITVAEAAFEAKAKELGVTVDVKKFRP